MIPENLRQAKGHGRKSRKVHAFDIDPSGAYGSAVCGADVGDPTTRRFVVNSPLSCSNCVRVIAHKLYPTRAI